MTYRNPVVYKDGKHEPMDTGVDQLDAASIPVMPINGNLLRVVQSGNNKGLFVGSRGALSVAYVSSSGTDAPGYGSKAQPFKTVDYALQMATAVYGGQGVPVEGTSVPETSVVPADIVIVMKAGEVFTLSNSYQFTGNIVLTYYGDPNYGDFNGAIVGGNKAYGATMTDLNRPQLNCVVDPSSANGITHFKGLNNLVGSMVPTLTLLGVTVNLPAGTSNSDYQDLLTVEAERDCRLQLIGAKINKTDTGTYGLMGVHSRGRGTIEQYASQLLVAGVPVQAGASNAALLARQAFIKFYPERLGNSQLGGMLNSGYPGTGMVTVQWPNCLAELVIPGKTSQVTYPVTGDPSMGLGNYFTNLNRDPQARPYNVICPTLL